MKETQYIDVEIFNGSIIFIHLQICTFLQGGSVRWIEDQMVPYAIKGNEWVGFDNRQSFAIKVINSLSPVTVH